MSFRLNTENLMALSLLLHDTNDLSNLPEKAVSLLEKEEGTRIILLLGFGLGGYPKVLHENFKGDGILIVYEAIPELFKIALQEQDLTSLLSSERVKIILGEETEDVSFVSKYHRKIVQKSFYILKQNGCVALNEPAYERFRIKVTEAKRLSDSRVVTGIRTWCGMGRCLYPKYCSNTPNPGRDKT